MLISNNKNVIVQGITGKESRYWVKKMMNYGTNIVAGIAPGKGGQSVEGIPVYDSVKDAAEKHDIDTSLIFVSPSHVETATMEAIDGGVKEIVILADGVPVHHTMRLISYGKKNGVRILGPNTPGLVYPGNSFIGIMPAWLPHVFKQGEIGVVSRSGSLGNEVSYQVVQAGFGISHFIGIGGDLLVGTTIVEVLEEFEEINYIKAIVLVGELGGNMEEQASTFIQTMSKPVFALIAGKSSPIGVSMGHAGAIVEGTEGSAENKQKILKDRGAYIANTPFEIGELLKKHLK